MIALLRTTHVTDSDIGDDSYMRPVFEGLEDESTTVDLATYPGENVTVMAYRYDYDSSPKQRVLWWLLDVGADVPLRVGETVRPRINCDDGCSLYSDVVLLKDEV